jgi:chlorite dismutase
MNQHMAVGHTYPSVKLNTTYSFGLDDQEFVLAFESDEPGDFLDLVQELRSSVSSAYTATDVPIFTCIQTTAAGMLDALAATRDRVTA